MKATYPFDQIAQFRLLVEQKGVSSSLLQEFYDSGVLADLLEVRKPKELDREAVRKACGLPPLNPPLPPLLDPVGTVTIAATDGFAAREKFVLNYGKKAKPGVRVAYLGDNFTEWFLGKTEGARPEARLDYSRLTRSALDAAIRKEIGKEREETTLTEIWALLEKQPEGGEGALLANAYANIFYVLDANGGLRAVDVRWDAGNGGWYVGASSVGRPARWRGGFRVFSRNSSVAQTV